MRPKQVILFSARLLLLAVLGASLSGCVLATMRSLDEDTEAKIGFTGEGYVEEIWEDKLLPTYDEQAQDFTALLNLLRSDPDAAIEQYGHRSGTGPYAFMVRGEAQVVTLDTSSRSGIITLDLAPSDGTSDATMAIGPMIKVSQRGAVRDAVGFIEYGAFTNQQEFADVATAMGSRITAMIASALGLENIDAIRDMDPAQIEGKTIEFIGAISMENLDDVIVVPVRLRFAE